MSIVNCQLSIVILQIPDQKLKEILARDGVIDEKEFNDVIEESKRMGQSASNILIARNIINTDYFNGVVADYYGVERANLLGRTIGEGIIDLLPEEWARQKRAIVFGKREDGALEVAMEDPNNLETIEFLSQFLKAKIKPYLASQEDLNRGFSFYGKRSSEDFKKNY